MQETTYFLDRHDDIICYECGKNEDDNIQCKNNLGHILHCEKCKKSISFVGQIFVRLYTYTEGKLKSYKFFRKVGSKYELHPDYLDYGFKSKAKAEHRAREVEQGGK